MHVRTLALAATAAATLAACGQADLPVTGAAPATPRAVAAAPICVGFNVPPAGALFGAPIPNPPGSVVWVESGIPVSVNKFLLAGGGTAYNWLRIEPVPAAFTLAAGNTGHTSDIGVGFDFTGLPFVPTAVTFHYLHLGGYENLAVNGSPIFVGPITAPPPSLAGLSVVSTPVAVAGGWQGTVKIAGGPIANLLVGGQQTTWIDDVCAYP